MAENENMDEETMETEATDTDNLDTGLMDLGDANSGTMDIGDLDNTGSLDIGDTDSVSTDTGDLNIEPMEAGGLDIEPMETGGLDANPMDIGSLDTNPVNIAGMDTGSADIGSLGSEPMDIGAPQLTAQTNSGGSQSMSNSSIVAFQKIQQLKVKVQAVLGTAPLTVSELSNLSRGDLIELETKLGEPIEILANGDLIARAEIVVTQDEPPRFGLTLTEIVGMNGNTSS